MEKTPDRALDAVALVREIRDAQHRDLNGRGWEEKVAYFRDRSAALRDEMRLPETPPVAGLAR